MARALRSPSALPQVAVTEMRFWLKKAGGLRRSTRIVAELRFEAASVFAAVTGIGPELHRVAEFQSASVHLQRANFRPLSMHGARA